MGKTVGDFHVGDEVVYVYDGKNSRLKYGDVGTILSIEEGNSYPLVIRFPDYAGRFFNVDGNDPTLSSLRCSIDNVAVATHADCTMLLDELEGFLG